MNRTVLLQWALVHPLLESRKLSLSLPTLVCMNGAGTYTGWAPVQGNAVII